MGAVRVYDEDEWGLLVRMRGGRAIHVIDPLRQQALRRLVKRGMARIVGEETHPNKAPILIGRATADGEQVKSAWATTSGGPVPPPRLA